MHRFAILFVLGISSSLLAQDQPLRGLLIEGEDWELVSQGHKFTEGPAVDAQGNVLFTDVPEGKVYRVDAKTGKVELFLKDLNRISGLMFGSDGLLYGCQGGKDSIMAFDKEGLVVKRFQTARPNDLVVSGRGHIYFTDPGAKQVWHVSPDGKAKVVHKGIEFPNGIILWPKQDTLVVADSRSEHLWTFTIQADGTLSAAQPFYTLRMPKDQGNRSGADGMTVDTKGRLYVATTVGLQVFDPSGRLSGVIQKPQDKFLSNVVLAGTNLDTLYVTCADKVYRRKVQAQGLRYAK